MKTKNKSKMKIKNKTKTKTNRKNKTKTISLEQAVSNWNTMFGDSTPFDSVNNQKILNKMSGYQYICADIVSKVISRSKLRLYVVVPNGSSKFHKGGKRINRHCNHISVNTYVKSYLGGEHDTSRDIFRRKSLASREGIVEILDHPALDVMRDQNPFSNIWEFLYTNPMAQQFFGNAYFEKIRNTSGEVAELWLVPSTSVKIIRGKTTANYIDHYKILTQSGTPRRVEYNDMLNFKIPGPTGDVKGKSKVEVAWKYIELIDGSLEFQKSTVENHGRADFIMVAKNAARMSDDLVRLKNKWEDRFNGPSQSGKFGGIVPGDIEIKVIPRADFDFDNDSALISAISSSFGVPRYKVLEAAGAALIADNTVGQSDFLVETIDPYLTQIEEVLNENFLSEWDDSGNLFFAFDPIVPEDKEFKLKRQIEFKKNGIYTANRILAQEGEELVDGGDELTMAGNANNSNNNDSQSSTEDNKDNNNDMLRKEISEMISKIEIKEPVQQIPQQPKQPVVEIHNHYATEEADLFENLDEKNKGIDGEDENIEESNVNRIANRIKDIN